MGTIFRSRQVLQTKINFVQTFVQVFCTSLNGNTYGTKYQLSKDRSAGMAKLATRLFFFLVEILGKT